MDKTVAKRSQYLILDNKRFIIFILAWGALDYLILRKNVIYYLVFWALTWFLFTAIELTKYLRYRRPLYGYATLIGPLVGISPIVSASPLLFGFMLANYAVYVVITGVKGKSVVEQRLKLISEKPYLHVAEEFFFIGLLISLRLVGHVFGIQRIGI